MRLGKNKRTLDNVARIWAMVLDGKRTDEIGPVLGVSPQRVRVLCKAFGVPLPTSNRYRLAFTLPQDNARVVFAIAEETGMTNAEVLALMVRMVTAGGVVEAKRMMGKLAKKKRRRPA